MRCDASKAWPRLFHDDFVASMNENQTHQQNYAMETRVHAKNAVDVTYFAQCTSTFVDSDADIVLVEWFTNMFGVLKQGNRTGVDFTIEAIKAAAPRAVIVFVVWLKDIHARSIRTFVAAVAARQAADIVDIPRLLTNLETSQQKVPFKAWLARDTKGHLDHHPNAAGHWLVAKAVSSHLTSRLVARATTMRLVDNVVPGRAHTQHVQLSRLPHYAKCFDTADKLRVQKPLLGTWSLVDEGREKGVQKLGYVSQQPGDVLDINLNSWSRCSNATGRSMVRLGYLVSTRPGQGDIHLSCHGNCACTGIQGYLKEVNPFPILKTDAFSYNLKYFSMIPGMLNDSLSVTASTTFEAQWNLDKGPSCLLRAKHAAQNTQHLIASSKSRVRIDSLSFVTKCHLRSMDMSAEKR